MPTALAAWDPQARTILADALHALTTYDVFAAFRASTAARSSLRTPRELDWDPPSSADWSAADEATTRVQRQSAELFGAVSRSTLDPDLWRERRRAAEAARALADLGGALARYRDEAQALDPESDGGSAHSSLRRAWDRWETSATYWGVTRGERLSCA
jgi:hypothetical protein